MSMELNPLIIGVIAILVFMAGVVAIVYYNLHKLDKEAS